MASIHASWTEWKNLFSFEVFGRDEHIMVGGLGGSYGTERVTLGNRAFLKLFEKHTMEFRGDDHPRDEERQEFKSAIQEDREPAGSG